MGACTQNILLQAVEEGLGAVWLGTYPDEERVNYLKEHFKVLDVTKWGIPLLPRQDIMVLQMNQRIYHAFSCLKGFGRV